MLGVFIYKETQCTDHAVWEEGVTVITVGKESMEIQGIKDKKEAG